MDASELGFGGSYESYRVLSIDNGTDTAGTGATGAFVIKSFKDGAVTREMFAPEFEGVIMLSRATLKEKGKVCTWKTSEFNPINKNARIAVLSLLEGKPIKDAEGNYKVAFATLDEIKEKMSYTTPKGVERTYNYFVVLYVYIPDTKETVKLVFKGSGRKNFFDYMNALQRQSLNPFDVVTKFGSKIDDYSKFGVTFTLAKNEDGTVKKAPVEASIGTIQNNILASGRRIGEMYEKSAHNLLGAKVEAPVIVEPKISDAISDEEIPFEG